MKFMLISVLMAITAFNGVAMPKEAEVEKAVPKVERMFAFEKVAQMPVTRRPVSALAKGIVADGRTDQSAALQKLVDGAADGTEFVFPAGAYFLSRPIVVKERRDLLFCGET